MRLNDPAQGERGPEHDTAARVAWGPKPKRRLVCTAAHLAALWRAAEWPDSHFAGGALLDGQAAERRRALKENEGQKVRGDVGEGKQEVRDATGRIKRVAMDENACEVKCVAEHLAGCGRIQLLAHCDRGIRDEQRNARKAATRHGDECKEKQEDMHKVLRPHGRELGHIRAEKGVPGCGEMLHNPGDGRRDRYYRTLNEIRERDCLNNKAVWGGGARRRVSASLLTALVRTALRQEANPSTQHAVRQPRASVTALRSPACFRGPE